MAPPILTPNAIAAVVGGDLNLRPVLQVVELRRINGTGAAQQERFGAVVSDGTGNHQALLACQLGDLARDGRIRVGSVVQLLEYICSTVQNRRIIVILNLEVIMVDCKIIGGSTGDSIPVSISSSSKNEKPQNRATLSSLSVFKNTTNAVPKFLQSVQPSYMPPPSYKTHGAIMKNEAPARIIPISALNPYQGCWAIKARVTAKGDLRRYNNAKGDGKVFSFDLLDSDGGEVRVTCFNAIADRFYGVIEVGKLYVVSKGSLKPAQKNFNHLKNEWEIFLENVSTVNHCPDEDYTIPSQQFDFRPIGEIEHAENNSILDVVGIVVSVAPAVTIMKKNGMETQRRIAMLKDMSGRSVELTMWGEICGKQGSQLQELLDSGETVVLAVKAGRVNDFSGKSVGTISSTQLFINPDIPETLRLKRWFDGEGKNSASRSISQDVVPPLTSRNEVRITLAQIKDEGLGMKDKPDWVTVKASLTFVKVDFFCYAACPLVIGDRACSKKVTPQDHRKWWCDRCESEIEDCDYRYLLQLQFQDYSGLAWMTAFQESGREILRCSAKELFKLKEEGDDLFGEIVRRSLFEQYLLRLKIKQETYGDDQRVKITVVKAEKIDPSMESWRLLDSIARW